MTGRKRAQPECGVGTRACYTPQQTISPIRKLQKEQEFSDAAISSLPGIFYLVDQHHRLLRWNKNLELISGYSPEEIGRMNALDFVREEDRPLAQARMAQVFAEGRATAEFELVTKSGCRIPYFLTGQRFEFEGRLCLVGSGIDISSRKCAEATLRQQNARVQLLSDIASQLLSSTEPQHIVKELFSRLSGELGLDVFFNYRVQATETGGERLELDSCAGVPESIARSVAILRFGEGICGRVAQERERQVVRQVQQTTAPEAQWVRQLGLHAYVCYPLIVEDRLLGALSFGSRQHADFTGEDLQFLQTLASYVAIARDRMRQRRGLEKLVADRTANLQQTVQSLEQVLYHVAHDLRAPLRSMEGFTSILLQQFAPQLNAEGERLAQRVSAAALRMDRLIRDLLAYGKLGHAELELRRVRLGAAVGKVLDYLEPELSARKARVEVKRPLPAVRADAGLLREVLLQLVTNAYRFAAPERTPEIRIRGQDLGTMARFWVEDNGIGITAEHRERIFRVFERLSQAGEEGTGMGLAIVKKAVERMGGEVGVESTVGEGSRFWVMLPAAPADADEGG